ncbi:MAG: hypothetical protein AUK43_20305 [Oscillatoriales cyanobacterium CG2_30_40_61]|nr:MAG: hypothetical protein AUK43_20305 [Oscillatoriales cyanobacterium CG2_30_40_61]
MQGCFILKADSFVTSPPAPLLQGEERIFVALKSEMIFSNINCSPFPCREGGWGVRSYKFWEKMKQPCLKMGELEGII